MSNGQLEQLRRLVAELDSSDLGALERAQRVLFINRQVEILLAVEAVTAEEADALRRC